MLAVAAGLLTSGCATFGGASASPTAQPVNTGQRSAAPGPTASTAPAASRSSPAGGSPGAKVLAGKIVGIDPGHNEGNFDDPAYIDHLIWNGRELEACNTTGTETDSGYTEATFNFNVASYLAVDLRQDGARVVMTRTNNHGVGPCVNRRAQILNNAHVDVAIDIHGDGGPSYGRGFTVLEPVADGINNKVITASIRFGHDVHAAFLADTPMQVSDYYGQDGYIFRDNLAGLNLTKVPVVLIECGNMRNAGDATLMTTARVQQEIARGLEAAIIRFLTGH